jgi:membrane associated rhomboid family serine protease
VFARQLWSEHEYRSALHSFCDQQLSRNERIVATYLQDEDRHFCAVMLDIRKAPEPQTVIRTLAEASKPMPFYRNRSDGIDYIYTTLLDSWRRFERTVPRNLTDDLSYDPGTFDIGRMVTAAFTHADTFHLVSNLVFFFAFAAAVEVIVGYSYYFFFLLLTVMGTHLAYAYSVHGAADALPTVGLSGEVMAMMTFLAAVAPSLRIRCFFWLLIIFRTFRVPISLIAALYVAENLYDYANVDPDDHVNYMAHISGAAIGALAGLIYRLTHREYLERLMA